MDNLGNGGRVAHLGCGIVEDVGNFGKGDRAAHFEYGKVDVGHFGNGDSVAHFRHGKEVVGNLGSGDTAARTSLPKFLTSSSYAKCAPLST